MGETRRHTRSTTDSIHTQQEQTCESKMTDIASRILPHSLLIPQLANAIEPSGSTIPPRNTCFAHETIHERSHIRMDCRFYNVVCMIDKDTLSNHCPTNDERNVREASRILPVIVQPVRGLPGQTLIHSCLFSCTEPHSQSQGSENFVVE